MAHTLLTYEERQIIEKRLLQKKSQRDIAGELSRDHTVIGREIRRNSGEHLPYSADRAQLYAEKRIKNKKKCVGKLQSNEELKEIVIEKLKTEWSPEQIGGWLKEQCKDPPGHISHETIYKYIYSREGKEEKLWQHLRTNRNKRMGHGSRRKQCERIPDRTPISNRPEEINTKNRYGDWESDTVESAKAGKGGLSSHYERKSQVCRLHKLWSKRAEETVEKLMQTKDSLPDHLFLTVTFDNGTENTKHTELRQMFGIDTYFCDPYCSWQKGGVENLNKLIRQYFPKKTDFSKITEEEIYEVQEKLNNRPRKSLNYRTPNEVLTELTGGATNP